MDFTHISNALEFSKKGTNHIAKVGVDTTMDLGPVDSWALFDRMDRTYLGLKALATIDKSAKTMAMEMSAVVESENSQDDCEWN